MESRIEQLNSIFDQQADPLVVRWSPDDSHIASACSDGTAKVYQGNSGNFLRSLSCRLTQETLPVTCVRWRPQASSAKTKNVLLCTTAQGGIFHWHVSSGKLLHSFTIHDNQILSCDYSPQGKYFAIGCKDFTVKVVEESTKEIVVNFGSSEGEFLGHGNRVFSVKWIDENLLVSAGWDNTILLWDLRTGVAQRHFYGPHVCGDSLDIKGQNLLAGSYNSKEQLQIWNWTSGNRIHCESLVFGNQPLMVYAAQYSKFDSGEYFAVGGSGNSGAFLYNSITMRPVGTFDTLNRVTFSIDFANTMNKVCVSSNEGHIRVFGINS